MTSKPLVYNPAVGSPAEGFWLKKRVKNILHLENGQYIYIYKWDTTREEKKEMFAVDYNDDAKTILIISLPYPQFERKYNHLTLLVNNVNAFKTRLWSLSKMYAIEIGKISILPDVGHDITRDFSAKDMVDGKNKGVVVRVYAVQSSLLYKLLQKNASEYCIQSMARYQNVVQCFSNHFRYEQFQKYGRIVSSLRGLFRVDKSRDGRDFSLRYIKENDYHSRPYLDVVLRPILLVGDDKRRGDGGVKTYDICRQDNGQFPNDGREKEALLDILKRLDDHPGLIIAMNEARALFLRKRLEYFNLDRFYPDYKLSVKLGRGVKPNEVSHILRITDECPSLEATRNFNIAAITTSLLENFFQSIIFAPMDSPFPSKNRFASPPKKIPGGLVLTPTPGRYAGVTCLDFHSLYPNIMAHFGIIKGRVCRVAKKELDEDKEWYSRHFHVLETGDDENFGYLSLKDGDSSNPVRVFCRYLLEKRRQNPTVGAFKLMANSLYGLFACRKVSLYSSTAATTVTKYGRFFLKRAVQFFETRFGLKCIYGDTDSLFVHYHRYEPNHLASEYNKKYPCIPLKVEATFERLIFIRKKLYLGKTISVDGKGYKFSGFSTKFLRGFRKLLCSVINAATEKELDAKKQMMTTYFFERFGDESAYWNTFIEPLLLVLKREKEKKYQARGYQMIKFDHGRDAMALNRIVLSNYKSEIIWKRRRATGAKLVLFSSFAKREGDAAYRLSLDDAPDDGKRFENLDQLEKAVLIPLLGKDVASLVLYVSVDRRVDTLYNFLRFAYNDQSKEKINGEKIAFVLPYDVFEPSGG